MRYDERYQGYARDYGRRGEGGRERRPGGYAADYRRGYDRDRGYGYRPPFGDAALAEGSFAMGPGFMPLGWGWYGPMGMDPGPFPFGPRGRGAPERPPRRPEESPAYGRGGDEELRRWARERGYDVGYAIYPRDPRRGR
ncbi:MAG: hypothetical protein ABW277_01490 [Longimicrobiaceae bacterium]